MTLENGPPSQYARMSYLIQTLGKYKRLAETGLAGVRERHSSEALKLAQAVAEASNDTNVRKALEASVVSNELTLADTEKVYTNIINFSKSVESLLQAATSKDSGCEQTACGMHSSCTETTSGAVCVCDEGYVGLGTDCAVPPELKPRTLLYEGTGGTVTQATDMHIAVFEQNVVGIVFRDITRGNIGRVVIGSVREAGMSDLAPPEQFTASGAKAYDPVIAGTEDGRFAVAWRDEARSGACYMRGGALGTTNIRGATKSITWGTTIQFCKDQAHKMAIVSLPANRVAVMFADKVMATRHTPTEYFGNSIFAQIDPIGDVTVGGAFRFANYAVTRLEATKISSKAFVVAARGASEVDEMEGKPLDTKQQAIAIYGEVLETTLIFDPTPVNLAPNSEDIWARDVSLIAPNTFAYAYQDGGQQNIKLAVVQVDPMANSTANRMSLLVQPTVIHNGFSPYVNMLSVPYTAAEPHTLVYYEANGISQIHTCTWDFENYKLTQCEAMPWLNAKVTSVSGVHLGGGKAYLTFAPESGRPYISAYVMAKKP